MVDGYYMNETTIWRIQMNSFETQRLLFDGNAPGIFLITGRAAKDFFLSCPLILLLVSAVFGLEYKL